MDLDVYLVGGIDFLAPIFRGLVILLGGSWIESFIKLNALLGLIILIWYSIVGRDKFLFAKHYLTAVFLVNLFFAPIVNLTLVDTKYQKTEVIRNFPFIPGVLVSLGSTASDFFTRAIDSLFHTGVTVVWQGAYDSYVTDLDYRNNGFSGVFGTFRNIMSYSFRGYDELFDMLFAYSDQCFLPYLVAIKQSDPAKYKEIIKDWDLIGSGNLAVTGFLMEYEGKVYACNDFYEIKLRQELEKFIDTVRNRPELVGLTVAEAQTADGIVNTLTKANYEFATAVSQASILNVLNYVVSSKTTDSYSVLGAYLAGRAYEQTKVLWRSAGEFMSELLPKLRNYLIAIAVLFSFMVIPMIMVPVFGAPTPGSAVAGFAKFILWAWFWDPMLALLDAGMKIYAIQQATSWLTQAQAQGISVVTHHWLLNELSSYAAVGGFVASAMVPTLSWMFFRGFDASATAIGYMFSGASARVREEFANLQRNVALEKYATMTGAISGGELSASMIYYDAFRSTAGVESWNTLKSLYGETDLFEKQVSTQVTTAQQTFGQTSSLQEFASKYFGGNVELAQRWMTGVDLLMKTGDYKAFEAYINTLGLQNYTQTRLMELLNETAKMMQKKEVSQMLGYIDQYGFERGVYEYLKARHMSDNQIVLNPFITGAFADWLERSGFGDLAKEVREGKWTGATVRFGYDSERRLGTVHLEKGSEAVEFRRRIEEDSEVKSWERIDERRREVVNTNVTRTEWGFLNNVLWGTNISGSGVGASLYFDSPDRLVPVVMNLLRNEHGTYALADNIYNYITGFGDAKEIATLLTKTQLKGELGMGIKEFLSANAGAGIQRAAEENYYTERNILREAILHSVSNLYQTYNDLIRQGVPEHEAAREVAKVLVQGVNEIREVLGEGNVWKQEVEAKNVGGFTAVREGVSSDKWAERLVKDLQLPVEPAYVKAMFYDSRTNTINVGAMALAHKMLSGKTGQEALEELKGFAKDYGLTAEPSKELVDKLSQIRLDVMQKRRKD